MKIYVECYFEVRNFQIYSDTAKEHAVKLCK